MPQTLFSISSSLSGPGESFGSFVQASRRIGFQKRVSYSFDFGFILNRIAPDLAAAGRKVLLVAARYLFPRLLVLRAVRILRLEIRHLPDKPASPARRRSVVIPNDPASPSGFPIRDARDRDGQVFGVAALRALLWGLLLLFAVDHTGLLRTDLQSGSALNAAIAKMARNFFISLFTDSFYMYYSNDNKGLNFITRNDGHARGIRFH
jgi:hypothetical protein